MTIKAYIRITNKYDSNMAEKRCFKTKGKWVADVAKQAAYSYINILKRENPSLEYFIGEPSKNKLDYVGIYSSMRVDLG